MSVQHSIHPHDVRGTATRRVAFAFQGGGSLTAPQVGMLRALTDAGVVPDMVVGSSAGALNALAFASDPTELGIDRLEALWSGLRRRTVARFSPRTVLAAVAGRADGLVSNAPMRALLEAGMVMPSIEATVIAAHVVSTDLLTGAAVVLSGGDTVPALLSSCAYPGLYPPVEVSGRRLIDGGVSADIPVLQAEELGADVTIVLPAAVVDDTKRPPRGPLPLAYRALGQILDATGRRDAAAARGQVHVLPAPGSTVNSPIDFRQTRRLIDDGYRLAQGWLATGVLPATLDLDASDATDTSSDAAVAVPAGEPRRLSVPQRPPAARTHVSYAV